MPLTRAALLNAKVRKELLVQDTPQGAVAEINAAHKQNLAQARTDLEKLTIWIDDGRLKPHVCKSYDCEDARLAFHALETGGGHKTTVVDGRRQTKSKGSKSFRGKVVLTFGEQGASG